MNLVHQEAYFDREVLDPVTIDMVITHLIELRERRAQFGIEGTSPRPFTQQVAVHMKYLRQFTPDALLKGMTTALAEAVIEASDSAGEKSGVSTRTEAAYERKSANLFAKYRADKDLEFLGDLSPLIAVSCLFEQAKTLASASWNLYRSVLLFAFRKTRADYIRCSERHSSYDQAIAILLIVNKAPYPNENSRDEEHDPRDGIPSADLVAICKYLNASPVNRSRQAMTFLQVTVATGLRPCEWLHAEYVAPVAGENDGYPTLFVRTAKDKTGAIIRHRTLVLRTREVQALALEQLDNVDAAIADAPYDAKVPPLDNLTKKVSALVKNAGRTLWPHGPKRWPTIYSGRHQARANFAREFGEVLAAAMLGHGFDVGHKHYASKRRGSKGGPHSAVTPGLDVIKRADEMRAKLALRKLAEKPWERAEPVDDGNAPGSD